jgi:DNA-binding protein YbaB
MARKLQDLVISSLAEALTAYVKQKKIPFFIVNLKQGNGYIEVIVSGEKKIARFFLKDREEAEKFIDDLKALNFLITGFRERDEYAFTP